jgi:multidrug efflux pump subunit AcrB
MSAIPFGLIGAFWGHMITGFDLSMFSIIGLMALTGVVVNDSLVLLDYISNMRDEGNSAAESVRLGAARRFRAILLTTLTTFAGLTPLLLEKSLQARFMIPMAVSLAFGVVFATFITLVLVPALYMIVEDIKLLAARLFKRQDSSHA